MKATLTTAALCLSLAMPLMAQEAPRAGQLALELEAVNRIIAQRTATVIEYASGAAALQLQIDGNAARCSGVERDAAFEVGYVQVLTVIAEKNYVAQNDIRSNLATEIEENPRIKSAAVLCSETDNSDTQNAALAGWILADRANVTAQALTAYRVTLERQLVDAARAQTE